MRRLLFALLALAILFAPLSAARAQASSAAAQSALAWMRTQQQPDGSFAGFGPGETADVAIAFAANGENAASFSNGGATTLDFLQAQGDYARGSVGAAAKLTMAAVALGADPQQFAGVNLLQLMRDGYNASTGQFGADVYGHALALLAIQAVQAAPPPPAVQRLLALQLPDGGWSFDGTAETGSDTNTTGLVVQALVGQPGADEAVQRAAAYLQSQQNADGGFPYSQASQFGNASDANSTAAVLQALAALGISPSNPAWSKGENTPLSALLAFQNPNGALRYQATPADDNALATYQAVPALLGKRLPVVTADVPGAEDALVVPVPLPAPVAQPATLPATGAADNYPAHALLALAVLCLAVGARLRRHRA
jgi:hypothetical protein